MVDARARLSQQWAESSPGRISRVAPMDARGKNRSRQRRCPTQNQSAWFQFRCRFARCYTPTHTSIEVICAIAVVGNRQLSADSEQGFHEHGDTNLGTIISKF